MTLRKRTGWTWVMALAVAVATMAMSAQEAFAVPSFARQTGQACEACHTVFPELTPYGRLFKLNGYVFTNVKDISDINAQKSSTLSLTELPPISLMFLASETHINKALPDSSLPSGVAQNDTIGFPQQVSFFYAGRIAPDFGAFIQLTYDPGANSVGIDNTDLRFADSGTLQSLGLIYGLTLNNNPTSQDVWNGTPAWGYPYATFRAAPSPAAAALIDGPLAQNTAGATLYLMLDKTFYFEGGAYRSAKVGTTNKLLMAPGPLDSEFTNVIDGLAPYWRFAYEHPWGKNSLEIGTYGIHSSIRPNAGMTSLVTSGPTDDYTDAALDAQYQWIGEDNLVTLAATWIHEFATRHATVASNVNDSLDTLRATATYYYQRRYGGSVQLFQTTGTTDPLVYPAAAVTGSRNGSPDTRGLKFEFDYVPWLNTKIGLQYTAYLDFNGASKNYDGFGRNASDNNTLYAFLWTAF